ncbi:acid trehalase [Penicillium riverlandense]|uniref:acid trehalase n=1 Tax=Penicillium riverlandense TaxID=1903569 RepID=UPI0025479B8E|nr:acid trehalase [Penicillium riverlandense]KAJ5826171.1 acid trehalase [Penicillium riverlandense]
MVHISLCLAAILAGSISPASASQKQKDSVYNTRFPGVTWDNNAWTLTSTNSNNTDWYSQSFVSNGYIGASFASTGPFPHNYGPLGGPYFNDHVTFSTIAGFFDRQPNVTFAAEPWLSQYGWESSIAGIPSWGSIVLDLGNGIYLDGTIDEAELSNVTLQQDYKQSTASYSYTWSPRKLPGAALDISYMVLADRLHPNRAYVRMSITSSTAMSAKVVNIIDGATSLRTDFVEKGMNERFIHTAIRPEGVSNVTGWIFSTLDSPNANMSALRQSTDEPYISTSASTIAQGMEIKLQPHRPVSVVKYVGIASSDAFEDPEKWALKQAKAAVASGFEKSLQGHIQEWRELFPTTAVTSFADPTSHRLPAHLVGRQITTVVAAAMLLMTSVTENNLAQVNNAPINMYGFGVCGLLSDCYGGQRYWDQDIWMGPYLFATNPVAAKQIPLSRTYFYHQAQANIGTAWQGSKRNYTFSPGAADYAWSQGRDGNCSAFAPCWDYEYHNNGDIVLAFIDYWAASGDDQFFKESLLPITNSIATFYSDLLRLNESTGTWTVTNMTDPDEYASFVDNGAYTMALMQYTLLNANAFNSYFGESQNSHWDEQAYAIEIPIDKSRDLTLEYTGMPSSISIKQADVVLLTYPLNNNNNATFSNQIENLQYYASQQALDGPGMTYAIYSIDSSVLEPEGCAAYTYDLYSWTPYVHGPWFTTSEQMDDGGGAYPFFTGMGGILQVDLMGYLGLRYGMTPGVVQVYPVLPPQIPYMRFPTFYVSGWPVHAEATQEHTILRRSGEKPLATANPEFGSKSITVQLARGASDNIKTFELPPGGTLRIPNMNSQTKRNVVQCRPVVYSEQAKTPGQFSQAAIDGSNSTSWLADANKTSSFTVDLSGEGFQVVNSLFVQWTTAPPADSFVIFHNTSSSSGQDVTKINLSSGAITSRYNRGRPEASLNRQVYQGSVNISLAGKGVWTGRYATLLIDGSTQQTGVAEWSVLV